MSDKGEISNCAIFGAAGALVSFFLFRMLLLATCPTPPHMYAPVDPTLTALVLAATFGIIAFLFAMSTGAFGAPDRTEKIVLLVGIGWSLLWIAYSFVEGDFCSTRTVRSGAAYLMVPIALLALGVFGRRWLNAGND